MKTTVLMHDLFENSYKDLDGSVKGRVLSFMVKLQQDPNGTGLDFKHPKGAANKHVRTARVNDQYLSLIHISEPTRRTERSRMPSSA